MYKILILAYLIGQSPIDTQQTFQMHRLAAMAFLPNPLPQDRIMVHHINQDKYDYALSNLEWVTPSYNNQDSWENRTPGMKAMESVTYV